MPLSLGKWTVGNAAKQAAALRNDKRHFERVAEAAAAAATAAALAANPANVDDDGEEVDEVGEDTTNFVVPGYAGKPKGMLQVLYERGLYRVGMQKEVTEEANAARAKRDPPLPPIPTEMDASATLGRCEDYANEVSLLEQLFLDRGHILIPPHVSPTT